MKTILITGANGFIAGQLAAHCKANAWRVVGTVRGGDTPAHFDAVHRCSLGETLDALLAAERIDAVVHAANYAGRDEYDVNFRGTLRWLEETRAASAPLQIFLSSLSAAASRPTEYGRAKRDLEEHFLAAGGVVVRLGLVAGYGGIFGRMIDSVRRSAVLPLLDGGRSQVLVVSPRFLFEFITDCIRRDADQRRGRVWHIHQPTPHTMRDLLYGIRRHCGASCRFVTVPSALVLWPLVVAERIPLLRLPVSSANIRGLRMTQGDVPSDLTLLGGIEEPLDRLIEEATRT